MQTDHVAELVQELTMVTTSNVRCLEEQAVRKRAAELARNLWLELEEIGDLIDRLIYSVCLNLSR